MDEAEGLGNLVSKVFTQVGNDLEVVKMKVAGERVSDRVLLPREPLRVVRNPVLVKVACHRSGDRKMKGTLVSKTRLGEPSRRRGAVALAEQYIVRADRRTQLVFDPEANQSGEKLERVQGPSADQVRLQSDPPRNSALQAIPAHPLRASVDSYDPVWPACHQPVDRHAAESRVQKVLP